MPPSIKMLSSLVSYFNTITSCSILGLGAPNSSSFIYRDELNNKSSLLEKKAIKKGDYCKDKREPLLVSFEEEDYGDNKKSIISGSVIDHQDQQKGVTRVKVKMTKQEAARLMSKCREGGIIGFKDVANELVQVPVHRIKVVSNSSHESCGVLETIPEEEIW